MSRAGTLKKRKLSKPEHVEWEEVGETLAEWYRSMREVAKTLEWDTTDVATAALAVSTKRSARKMNDKLWSMARKLHLLGY